MNKFVKHLVIPAVAPAAVIDLYFTPVERRNRGLLALAVVLASAVAAFISVGIALRTRMQNQAGSGWWIVSTIILTVPIVLILGPLG